MVDQKPIRSSGGDEVVSSEKEGERMSEKRAEKIEKVVDSQADICELATAIELNDRSQNLISSKYEPPTLHASSSSELSDPSDSDSLNKLDDIAEIETDQQENGFPHGREPDLFLNELHKDLKQDPDSPLSSISSISPNLSPKRKQLSEDPPPSIPKQEPQPESSLIKLSTTSKRKNITKSPYFSPKKSEKKLRPPPNTISCIPFPPLTSPHFGLLQEKFAHDPFWLLIGITFLKRTHGKQSIPIFYQLYDKHETIENLADADHEEIKDLIRHLGLQDVKARQYIDMANLWLREPPVKGKRYRTLKYPGLDDGRDIKVGEILTDEDPRIGAWEIAHLPGSGDYAIDSWRIFCRDVLRGLAEDYDGKGANPVGESVFEPEWMRVVPRDKELRAFLRWMWLKEGWDWNPLTGEKEVAGEELGRAAREGNLVWDNGGGG